MTSPKALARTAGLLYLVVVAGAIFAEYVRSSIIASGNAAATAENIRAAATLFRAAFVIDLVQATANLLTAMALYLLLKHVHPLAAAAMVVFMAVNVAVMSLNLLNQYTALTIATREAYTTAFGQAGSDALATLFATMQINGSGIAAIFSGLWLLPLGYLVIKSGYFPRLLGILLIVGGLSYLANFFVRFLALDLARIAPFLAMGGAVGEVLFVVWLLIRAVRVPALPEAAPAVGS